MFINNEYTISKILYNGESISSMYINNELVTLSELIDYILSLSWSKIDIEAEEYVQVSGVDKEYVNSTKDYFSSHNFASVVKNGDGSYTVTASALYQNGYIKPSLFGVLDSGTYLVSGEPYLLSYELSEVTGSYEAKNLIFKNSGQVLLNSNSTAYKKIIVTYDPTNYSLAHQIICMSVGSFKISNLSIKKLSDVSKINYLNTGWTPPYNSSWTIVTKMNILKNCYFQSLSGVRDTDNNNIYLGQSAGRDLKVSVKSKSNPALVQKLGVGINYVSLSYNHLNGEVGCTIDGTSVKDSPNYLVDINTILFTAPLNSGNPLPFYINSINNSTDTSPNDTIRDFKLYEGVKTQTEIRQIISKDKSNIKIAMVADSLSRPESGYYRVLGDYLNSNVHLLSTGWGGATTLTFESLGKWDIVKELKADYHLIQFGTNDSTAGITDAVYEAQIRKFISESASKPILCTPPTPAGENTYWISENVLNYSNSVYLRLVQFSNIIKSIGLDLNIPVVDLNTKTKEVYESLGKSNVLGILFSDSVHFREVGAEKVSEIILSEVDRLSSDGFSYLSEIIL